MTTSTTGLPLLGLQAGFRRFTVAEYHKFLELGLLTEDDNLELIEGYLVHKMSRNPPHDGTLKKVEKRLSRLLPAGWEIRIQCAVTLPDSEPEPDLAVVREDPAEYMTRHPGPRDVGLVVEVADSTLPGDRSDKARIYARAGIVCYWIVNLNERQVEVYTAPSGPAAEPEYGQRVDHRAGDLVSFVLDGTAVGTIAAQELLP